MKNRIIIAADKTDWESVTRLGAALDNSGCAIKVGMELFYAHGTRALDFFASKNLPIFLDLKLHDIPNTVGKAIANLCSLPVFMVNVHASGGLLMMQAAHEARVKSQRKDLLLIAVTQLTSTSQAMMNQELQVPGPLRDSVLHLAELTQRSGLDGVVCSAQEVTQIKSKLTASFKCITPGIRAAGGPSHDQVRTMTPKDALAAGSDYLVIGRAITEAADPREALENFLR
jgi:orotidine-5'-phosphate decarboxylase